MFEICALLANRAPKVRKVSTKPRAKAITVGSQAFFNGHHKVTVIGRDGPKFIIKHHANGVEGWCYRECLMAI